LTTQEVVAIKGAISTSLGLFEEVAKHLSGVNPRDPIAEVLAYLEQFRIFLVLDNLETVMDKRIREFLERMPAGSKILITSRIGLGAFEYLYKLAPMTDDEAVHLLRAVAHVRGLTDLLKTSNRKLKEYCLKMKRNPGWIKWFVSAVHAGKRPEEVLDKPQVFLDFCMSNVYEYLTPESRKLLRSLLCVPGSHSQAELAFLNKIEVVELQRALQQLLTTNFVAMNSIPTGSSFETRYGMSELAREFLSKKYPPNPKEAAEFTKKKRQIVAAGEQTRAEQSTNPFSYTCILTRSNSDLIVARYLLDALRESKRKNFEAAEGALQTARDLAPEFFEVHRVMAIVKMEREDYIGAREAYDAALYLEPKSAPLRLWYGNFLLRYTDDLEAALEQFRIGLELMPDSPEIAMEIARAMLYKGEFDEAKLSIDSLFANAELLSEWNRRKVYDLQLSYYHRLADQAALQHDIHKAMQMLEDLRQTYEAIPYERKDRPMRVKVAKALRIAELCYDNLEDEQDKTHAAQLQDWIYETAKRELDEHPPTSQQVEASATTHRLFGSIKTLKKGFGFVRSDDDRDIYFNRSGLENRLAWASLTLGRRVSFTLGENERGTHAARVRFEP